MYLKSGLDGMFTLGGRTGVCIDERKLGGGGGGGGGDDKSVDCVA